MKEEAEKEEDSVADENEGEVVELDDWEVRREERRGRGARGERMDGKG